MMVFVSLFWVVLVVGAIWLVLTLIRSRQNEDGSRELSATEAIPEDRAAPVYGSSSRAGPPIG
ncbi:MAG: hypothetical protein ACRDM0_01665 [Thermoleophilaceae bacterium]